MAMYPPARRCATTVGQLLGTFSTVRNKFRRSGGLCESMPVIPDHASVLA
jgi:hypothetical protein